jgi:hypothetical protein
MKDLSNITISDFIKEKFEFKNGLRNLLIENVRIIEVV